MRAAWLTDWGTAADVAVVDRPDLVAGPGEVVVDVRAAAINFPDVLMIANKYQVSPELPFSPGSEFAGTVRGVGPGVIEYAVGDRVCGGVLVGAFAEQVSAPISAIRPLPAELSWTEGAAYHAISSTAYYALVSFGELAAGSTVVVLGAAGGVGSACVSMAKQLGATVIAVVSSEEKAGFARGQGADVVVNYRTEALKDRLKEVTGGGADIVVDPVGGSLSELALRAMRWGGRFIVVGFAAGEIPRIPLNLVLLKGVQVRGFEVRTMSDHWPEAVQLGNDEIARLIRDGWRPPIAASYPLDQVAEALQSVSDPNTVGKIVITTG
jgi:NADPH2:quinone reductase